MASPAGLALIAPTPRAMAVSLPDNPSDLTLAGGICAEARGEAASSVATAISAAVRIAGSLGEAMPTTRHFLEPSVV